MKINDNSIIVINIFYINIQVRIELSHCYSSNRLTHYGYIYSKIL